MNKYLIIREFIYSWLYLYPCACIIRKGGREGRMRTTGGCSSRCSNSSSKKKHNSSEKAKEGNGEKAQPPIKEEKLKSEVETTRKKSNSQTTTTTILTEAIEEGGMEGLKERKTCHETRARVCPSFALVFVRVPSCRAFV